MKKFREARLPFVTCFVMDKDASAYDAAYMITDGYVMAKKWQKKNGCQASTRIDTVIDWMFILWYDEITGIINCKI